MLVLKMMEFNKVMDVATLKDGAERRYIPLDQIGCPVAQVAELEEMLAGGRGMVLLVGPINSSMSTSMLSFINQSDMAIRVTTTEEVASRINDDEGVRDD